MNSEAKRIYRSPLRAAAAEATRRRILDAARKLFAERGFGGTTLEAVAAEAGVAVQTIQQAFGGKKELLRAQLDAIDRIGGVKALVAVLNDPASTPAQITRAAARFWRKLFEGAGDLIETARSSGDPELRSMLEGGLRRHKTGVAGMAARWARDGALAPGMSADRAAAIVASISTNDLYQMLKRDWAWSPRRYETWMVEAIERLVLDPSVWEQAGARRRDS
jgi:AcrR family transcriptional regulator